MFTKNLYFLLIVPLTVSATESLTVNPPTPIFFEQTPADRMPTEKIIYTSEPAQPTPSENLSGNILETQVNQALINRDWENLENLLEQYRLQNGYDPILYDYALGALRRSQWRHDEAVSLYRGIIKKQPDLAYPRFDLGVMLFENKQYREATTELQRARPDLQPTMQQLADRYLTAIRKEQNWFPEISAQYEATNNVNNAADARTIQFAGKTWQKTSDSLPQKAHGIRYGLGVSREINLNDHHFTYVNLSGNGIHYWDNQEYSEQSLNLATGYKNHSAVHSFGFTPFTTQNWLGGKRYSHVVGIDTDFSHRLNDKWRLALNSGYQWKRYHDTVLAEQYNSEMPYFGVTLLHLAPKNLLLYSGIDWTHDMTQDAEQASVRKGIRLGMVKSFTEGIGLRTDLRYTLRTFDAPGTLIYLFNRKDHEYQANASMWHSKFSWKGITPHLNVRYLKIDSNMKDFYSRKNTEWFISIEKTL